MPSRVPFKSPSVRQVMTERNPTSIVYVERADPEAERYAREPWNLNVLPSVGLLAHLEEPITGVQTPWLYVGSMFSSAAWQMEDDMLYSVAYHHVGEPRHWWACAASQMPYLPFTWLRPDPTACPS